MDEASEFGLKDGFSVPIFGPDGDQSCVTMGGEKLSHSAAGPSRPSTSYRCSPTSVRAP